MAKRPTMLSFLEEQEMQIAANTLQYRFEKVHCYYKGLYLDTVQETRELLEGEYTEEAHSKLYFTAPRMIRGITDYGIFDGSWDKTFAFKQAVVKVNQYIFSGDFEQAAELLEKTIEECIDENYPLLETTERSDYVTWSSSKPHQCRQLLEMLESDEFDVMVILGNGGYRAGFTIASELGIETLPVRLSIHKKHDTCPKYVPNEGQYVAEQCDGKRVLIFDEDTTRGMGLYITAEDLVMRTSPTSMVLATTSCADTTNNTPKKFTL